MSGIRTVFTVHISDIKNQCPGYGQSLLALFRTWRSDVRNMDSRRKMMSGIWTTMSGMRTVMSGIRTVMSGIRTVMSGIWTESFSDVRNMASFHWPYPGHRFLMSGIWPVFTVHILDINFWCGIWTVKTGHIPDIKSWCPEYGQWKLAIFQTSKSDVRNMASKNWPYSGHH